jgi:predicted metal-dependent hydrolase
MLIVAPGMAAMWFLGVRFLMANDPTGRRRPRLRDAIRARRRYDLPGLWKLFLLVVPYLKPGYHPSQYGSTSQAVAYLATSPAAMAADERAGR